MTQEEQKVLLSKGAVHILPAGGLEKKLAQGRPLIIKLGADPTAPDLHLGHAVVLTKLRQFQDAGHRVQFLIGDFTARIGDPSGKSKTRPPLDSATITQNAETYFNQVTKILDRDKTEILYNSSWLSKIDLKEFIKIAGKLTLARIIEREDFMGRLESNTAIGFHELFYPLLQAYDSVAMKADFELGGTDQTFNLLMGRYLQEQHGQEPQVILTMPLLEGLDGVQKMSKSLNNYIGLDESPEDAFGKLMSISDTLMWRYYELLTDTTTDQIAHLKEQVKNGDLHPLACKKDLAHLVVTRFWSTEEAHRGREHFEALFQKKDYSQAKEVAVSCDKSVWIVDLLRALGAVQSSSQARRLIQDGAVWCADEKVTDFKQTVTWDDGVIVKVGKHRVYKLKSQ